MQDRKAYPWCICNQTSLRRKKLWRMNLLLTNGFFSSLEMKAISSLGKQKAFVFRAVNLVSYEIMKLTFISHAKEKFT